MLHQGGAPSYGAQCFRENPGYAGTELNGSGFLQQGQNPQLPSADAASRFGHAWETLENEDFLLKLGVVGIRTDGKRHPTSAGLLMFGNEYDIVREFNAYFLDHQDKYDVDTCWTDRIISASSEWSGNMYNSYFRIYNKTSKCSLR